MKKKISKITVKHFLNKNLKAASRKKFPVYVSLWFQGKFSKVKSLWWIFLPGSADPADELYEEFNYMTEPDFNKLAETKDPYLLPRADAMRHEQEAITNIIKVYFEKYNQNIVSKDPGEMIQDNLRTIPEIISHSLKLELYQKFEGSNNVKLISARLMINWDVFAFINLFDGLSYFSNDGKNKTKFYSETLQSFEGDYRLLKKLYEYNNTFKYGCRFYQWLEDPKSFEGPFSAFLEKASINSKDIASFLSLCLTCLKDYRDALLHPIKS